MATSSVAAWTENLAERDLPVLKNTAKHLSSLASNEAKHISSLTNLILQDAGMTASILRIAKSAFYNPSGAQISTVSRAILVLGFDEIRSMCLSFKIIDTFLRGEPKQQVVELLAHAFHSATQARTIARAAEQSDPEEVFIAALLNRLGEVLFWSYGGATAEQLLEEYKKEGIGKAEAERNVLGFPLSQLRKEVAHELGLSSLLEEVHQEATARDHRVQSVLLASKLADVVEKGWDNPQVAVVTEKVAHITRKQPEELKQLFHEAAEEAVQMAAACGASKAARKIPIPESGREFEEVNLEDALGTVAEVKVFDPDPILQLKILRELSSLVSGAADFDSLLQMVLEGIYRGVGVDRVLFALLTPERQAVVVKFALSIDAEDYSGLVQLTPDGRDILLHALESRKALWLYSGAPERKKFVLPGLLRELVGKFDYMLAPTVVGQRSIGVFYADRAISERKIDKETFEAFNHFIEQANLGLERLAK